MVSESNKIGLIPAILMVAGNMMGSGVFYVAGQPCRYRA